MGTTTTDRDAIDVIDAIIVGAGPAGALTAHLLARAGARVLVLEASEKIRRKVCGEYLCPKGVELLADLGLERLAPARPITGMRIVSPTGAVVQARFPSRRGRPSRGFALDRRLFEEALLARARESGARVEMGARVTSIEAGPEGWSVHVRRGAGSWTARGALLIGADGRRSVVARSLGLRASPRRDRVALHGHFFHARKTPSFGEMHLLADGSYIGVDPTGDHEVNVSLVCSAHRVRELGGPRATLDHHLAAAPDYARRYGPFPEEAPLSAVCPITHDVRSCVAPGAALVGDAAGFLDPLTGEGIYDALLGARSLASALGRAASFRPAEVEPALRRYARDRARARGAKRRLNRSFQWVIRRPALVESLAGILGQDPERADSFLGTVGNVYGPLEGLMRTLSP